jgi:chaperonin cofactor prefoldin
MADSTKPADASNSRRNFLKIGAGVVAGAAVASVVEIPYYSSVIGSNNSNSSTTVSSLQSQLSATTSQLSDTQSSLSAAQGTISSLNSQLTSTQGQLSAAQSSLSSATSQNAALNSQLSSATAQVSTLQSQVTSANTQVTSLQSSLSSAQANLDTTSAFLSLSATEQVELAAIASAIIPTDSTGPGATTAGAVYFIDRQLKSAYGTNGLMYRQEPYIPANVTNSISVPLYGNPTQTVTYPGGSVTYKNGPNTYTVKYNPTANVRVGAGSRYQYGFDMKQFWTMGLAGIQAYSNAAYGGNFETLSAADQTQVLTDLWSNKPTYNAAPGSPSSNQAVIPGVNAPTGLDGSVTIQGTQFGDILPSDFAYELFFMVWNGFWVDPAYGGNKGMTGWKYVGWHGVNLGNFYNEGYTSKQLMVMTSPVTLQPASLGQYQKGSP